MKIGGKSIKLYDLVKRLLEQNEEFRDNDKKLTWHIWMLQGLIWDGVISKNDYMKAAKLESIGRVRRKVQENHPHLRASDVVEKARREKEQRWGGNFAYHERLDIKGAEK